MGGRKWLGCAPKIFCGASLTPVTRSTTNASRALQALCDSWDQSSFFSGSALDAWTAARFINHKTSLKAAAAEQPLSTEPNTPWLLADVVLARSQQQKRPDSWKKVRGDAQVDLMLCSDPSCRVVVDVLRVQRPGRPATKRWVFATSGISTSAFQTGVGTAANLDEGRMQRNDNWVPLDQRKEEQKRGNGEVTTVHDVVWPLSADTVLPDGDGCRDK